MTLQNHHQETFHRQIIYFFLQISGRYRVFGNIRNFHRQIRHFPCRVANLQYHNKLPPVANTTMSFSIWSNYAHTKHIKKSLLYTKLFTNIHESHYYSIRLMPWSNMKRQKGTSNNQPANHLICTRFCMIAIVNKWLIIWMNSQYNTNANKLFCEHQKKQKKPTRLFIFLTIKICIGMRSLWCTSITHLKLISYFQFRNYVMSWMNRFVMPLQLVT